MTEEFDLTEFEFVVKRVVAAFHVPQNTREDLKQECYLALLEKKKHWEGLTLQEATPRAVMICRSAITDVLKKQNQRRTSYKEKPNIRFSSMSDPKILRKAMEVVHIKKEVTDEELYWAILCLPEDERKIIYHLAIEEKSQEQVAEETGVSRDTVRTLMKNGIANLKKHFEVG